MSVDELSHPRSRYGLSGTRQVHRASLTVKCLWLTLRIRIIHDILYLDRAFYGNAVFCWGLNNEAGDPPDILEVGLEEEVQYSL